MDNAALFVFLAAASIAVFAFLSIAVWVQGQGSERKARDRFALLKTLAENSGENAQRVLAYLREEDERKALRREREERNGFRIGGLVCVGVGIGLWVMIPVNHGVGLLVILVGLALLPFGFRRSSTAGER